MGEKDMVYNVCRMKIHPRHHHESEINPQSKRESSIIPITLPPRPKLFITQLQKRLSHKPPSHIEQCRHQTQSGQLSFNFLKRRADRFGVRHIGADTQSFTAGLIDLVDDGSIVFGIAGEEDDGVERREFLGEGCTSSCVNGISKILQGVG